MNRSTFAPEPTRTDFDSWDEFYEYMKDYQRSTDQALRTRTTTSVALRNKRIKETARGRQRKAPPLLIPMDFTTYAVCLQCTHAGVFQTRGTGSRKSGSPSDGLPNAGMTKNARKPKDTHRFVVSITKLEMKHNHPLSKDNRLGDVGDDDMAVVAALRSAGAKPKKILQHSAKYVCRTFTEGRAYSGCAFESRRSWARDFAEEGNVGRIFTDEQNVVACITMQTKHMMQMIDLFPEVLMIDATHGTNASNYKLFSFMVHDAFGKGHHVQHALVENERRETLETAIEQFKNCNPQWKKIKCIIIDKDKDFTEMGALRACFPCARILLCQFHCVKYLHEEVAKSKYNIVPWQNDRMRSALSLMITLRASHHTYIKNLLLNPPKAPSFCAPDPVCEPDSIGHDPDSIGRDPDGSTPHSIGSLADQDGTDHTHPFLAYFHKNWNSCRRQWCSYLRENACTLGNNTNNRLEASWKQPKTIVHAFMTLDECILGIIFFQKICGQQYIARLSQLDLLLCQLTTTRCSCSRTWSASMLALSCVSVIPPFQDTFYIQVDDQGDFETLDEPGREYAIDCRSWSCSCILMTTRKLSCRNVFYIRRDLKRQGKVETTVPFQNILDRWLLKTLRDSYGTKAVSEPISFQFGKVKRRENRVLNANQNSTFLVRYLIDRPGAQRAGHKAI
ncbi:TPA: hypothetical protein N0F65_011902 [Lagenidium giganteum]|uniref:ZSWIM1/3 RNaseH-like domain-containing protein n=1 Tax=Lagenidium giganteum TaxID=4803 RepID=A0AAV2YJZ8_9STRA|nr:TPA: hypothetical protein N0F65_011902 [Lagenidium giganteum]